VCVLLRVNCNLPLQRLEWKNADFPARRRRDKSLIWSFDRDCLGASWGINFQCCEPDKFLSLTAWERIRFFLFSARQFCPHLGTWYHSTCHRNSLLNFAKVRRAQSAYKRVHAPPPNFLVNYEQERRRWQRQREKVLVERNLKLSPAFLSSLFAPCWKEELAVTHPADGWVSMHIPSFTWWFNNAHSKEVMLKNLEKIAWNWREWRFLHAECIVYIVKLEHCDKLIEWSNWNKY
jgi:hypothetical protein